MDVKKGTTTVGIICKGGIVLAADRRATAGTFIADKRAVKIHKIADEAVVTIAGSVSDAQLLVKLIRAEVKLKTIRVGRKPKIREIANLLAGFVYSTVRQMTMVPGIAHFLLGGKDERGFHIFDLFPDGSLSEVKDFVGSGSGSVVAYGVLEAQWKKDLSIEEGIKLAVKGVNAALQRDSATGDGLDVVTITEEGIKRVVDEELKIRLEGKK